MNDSSNATAELDQADEEILTFAVSDEALEAAAEQGRNDTTTAYPTVSRYCCP